MLNNLSLRTKIFLILLLALILTATVAIAGISYISTSYSDILYRNIAGQLSYSEQTISSALEDMETLSFMLLSNDHVQNNLFTIKYSESSLEKSSANKELRALLSEYYNNFRNDYLSYIDLYCGQFMVSGNAYASRRTPSDVHMNIQTSAIEADGSPVWVSEYTNDYGLFLGREIRRIANLSHEGLGEALLCIDMDALVKYATKFSDQYENASYLLLDHNSIFYYSEAINEETAVWVKDHLTDVYQVLTYNGHSYFAVRGQISRYDWDYICLVSYDEIAAAIRRFLLNIVIALLLCILAVTFLTDRLISSLVRHFDALIEKMEAVGRNEKELPQNGYDYSMRHDEIGTLHTQFDLTFTKLQAMIQTNYVNEILRQEAQLKALENQINPHFLYNTLESVNWRAKAIGADDISDMVQSLGTLLRSTLSNNTENYSLKNEMELVQCYMTIQKYRFTDRLHYRFDIAPEYQMLKIPKLSLQPLVENAIHYGLEENIEGCTIRIYLMRIGDHVHISVENSGSLFEEDLMGKLERGEITPHGHGIGLLNIRERIHLTFGPPCDLVLLNRNDCAVATLIIPYQPDGNTGGDL